MIRHRNISPYRRLWMLGMALGLFAILNVAALTMHSADAGPDISGALGTLNTDKARGQANILAGDRLIEILETVEDRKEVVVNTPKSAVQYMVRPIVSFSSNGYRCRTFTIRRFGSTSVRESYRTACRTPEGDWNISKIPDLITKP